jgi:hypothetical protein
MTSFPGFLPRFFPEQKYQQEVKSLGSGVLISADGYMLTNEHVVVNATKIRVTMSSGQQYDARIIASERTNDLALLKIDGTHHGEECDAYPTRQSPQCVGDCFVDTDRLLGSPKTDALRSVAIGGDLPPLVLLVNDPQPHEVPVRPVPELGEDGGPLVDGHIPVPEPEAEGIPDLGLRVARRISKLREPSTASIVQRASKERREASPASAACSASSSAITS